MKSLAPIASRADRALLSWELFDLDEFRNLIGDEDPKVRAAAVWSLEGAPEWVWDLLNPEVLLSLLDDEWDVRITALGVMWNAPDSFLERLPVGGE